MFVPLTPDVCTLTQLSTLRKTVGEVPQNSEKFPIALHFHVAFGAIVQVQCAMQFMRYSSRMYCTILCRTISLACEVRQIILTCA